MVLSKRVVLSVSTTITTPIALGRFLLNRKTAASKSNKNRQGLKLKLKLEHRPRGHMMSAAAAKNNLPQPEHSYDDWTGPISKGVCKDEPHMWTCKKEKIHGRADARQYNVYRFKAGTFKMIAQFLVPPNTYIVGNENPNPELVDVESKAKVDASDAASKTENVLNGAVKLPFDLDHPDKLRKPDYSKQTLFLATRGATAGNEPYCMNEQPYAKSANMRVGFVMSSHTGIVDISYQGVDVVRPADNGSLCGGAAFETKGCFRKLCGGSLNNGNSDGIASENVVIKNVRVNGLHYDGDKPKIGKSAQNGVRSTQNAVWVPQARSGSVSKNILVKNLVLLSAQGDGINFHGAVEHAVLENSYMQHTGDDIFAIWGGQKDSKQVLMKNTVGYNPGIMRPALYGVCVATYGIYSAYFKNHVCKTPWLPATINGVQVQPKPVDAANYRYQLNDGSMMGMYTSFDAKYKPESVLKFKNYFFGDLKNPATKHAAENKSPPNGLKFPMPYFFWSDTSDGVRAPYYKDPKATSPIAAKVLFKENWDESTELKFDAWMKEKMSPGWHPLEDKAGQPKPRTHGPTPTPGAGPDTSPEPGPGPDRTTAAPGPGPDTAAPGAAAVAKEGRNDGGRNSCFSC